MGKTNRSFGCSKTDRMQGDTAFTWIIQSSCLHTHTMTNCKGTSQKRCIGPVKCRNRVKMATSLKIRDKPFDQNIPGNATLHSRTSLGTLKVGIEVHICGIALFWPCRVLLISCSSTNKRLDFLPNYAIYNQNRLSVGSLTM